jgi:hypothetical protein
MPNNQARVVGTYLQQWQDGVLTNEQMVAVLVRKYAELTEAYERLEVRKREVGYPQITCRGCSRQMDKKSWNSAFHDRACYMRWWRRRNAVYDPKVGYHVAKSGYKP